MNELTIELQKENKRPFYIQIYEYIKKEIEEGRMICGEKLPSARYLSTYLQVSRNTVDVAYDQLVSEGYVETSPRRGYFVCDIQAMYQLGQIHAYKETKEVQTHEFTYDFSPYAIDLNHFPIAAWRKMNKQVYDEDETKLFAQGRTSGERNLKSAIGQYLHRARGVNCHDGQIVIGAGNEYLLMLLLQILGSSLNVAMENPTYKRAYSVFENAGCMVSGVPMDEDGMMVEALEKTKAQIAYVMPSHQFPLGMVMPIKRRMELLKWAAKEEGRYIIEDDYDSEFRYKGKPIPSLQGNDRDNTVIYMGTFSKSIAPAIRVSYMVLPEELMRQYKKKCSLLSSSVSKIQQELLCIYLEEGQFERHLNKMRAIYKNKRDIIWNAKKKFPPECTFYGGDAGLHILMKVDLPLSEEELIAEAQKSDVKIYGMKNCVIGSQKNEYRPTILLGYAGMDEEKIKTGMNLLKKIMENYVNET